MDITELNWNERQKQSIIPTGKKMNIRVGCTYIHMNLNYVSFACLDGMYDYNGTNR